MKCISCDSITVYAIRCKRCYNKNWSKNWREDNPDKVKEHNAKYNPKRIRLAFKGKYLLLKHKHRKGICSWCGKKGKTDTHHFAEYHDDDPLRDTIELCPSCHAFESWRLGQIRN